MDDGDQQGVGGKYILGHFANFTMSRTWYLNVGDVVAGRRSPSPAVSHLRCLVTYFSWPARFATTNWVWLS